MFDDHLLVAATCTTVTKQKIYVFFCFFFSLVFLHLNVLRQVIVTEQDIDEEIGKEVKDKAEDYRKLKYYQVAKYFNKYY